ncbi:unnamed protein product [Prorocentrum cordatum]|uniref:Reverse transcriptase domain-containing protein n=1 Tax=Prorocentrum cordatum TaxID=2364126 RepID=A0ABN9W7X8_9DINO|nr:unnamed protein product [Polarella glacialis]
MNALDWKKTFDSINVTVLLDALRFVVYHHTVFHSESTRGQKSRTLNRRSGIGQGCPRSPFLFVMVTSLVPKNAEDKLDEASFTALAGNVVVLCTSMTPPWLDGTLVNYRMQMQQQEQKWG